MAGSIDRLARLESGQRCCPRAPQENDTELVLPIEAINGPLRLPVTGRPETVEREPNDTNATANSFGPVNISGRIDWPGDVDRFAFDAQKAAVSVRSGFL